MAKEKQVFFCKECGFETSKWTGQCPGCREWNTMVESPKIKGKGKKSYSGVITPGTGKPSKITEVSIDTEDRFSTGIGELDRVLGGGVIKGALTLVGGDPGIGKSTLLLQMCRNMSENGLNILYVSGEESLKQIKMRADRIGKFNDRLFLLSETCLDVVEDTITGSDMPDFDVVVIDSIQTVYKEEVDSAPGSISQIRECTSAILRLAKQTGISVFIVGHVTKEGVVAGPRMLEHMVDTVLYFEGDNIASYRMLRAVKNRFGSTNELGVFEMKNTGLAEILNPSEYMLQGKPENEAGSIVTCTLEGTRPIMLEVQALVCQTGFNYPRRTAVGIDFNRVTLLMAIIEKRMGIHMSDYDVYVNIAGGLKVNEPSLDLAIVAAVLSSYRAKALDDRTFIFGEAGLVGEVRAVGMAQRRINEAAKMGYTSCIIPKANEEMLEDKPIKCYGIKNIRELAELI